MSNIFYEQFYMRFGVRSIGRLSNPHLFNLENFQLPKGAIVHYLPTSAIDLGPDQNYFPMRDQQLRPYVDNITVMTGNYGNPRRKGAFNPDNLSRAWLTKHRNYRRITDITRTMDDRNTAVLANYALIPMQYRYLPLPMTRFYRFQNIFQTLADRAKFYAEHSDRQQFLFIQIPDQLPNRMQLNVSVESLDDPQAKVNYRRQYNDKKPTLTYHDVIGLHYPGMEKELSKDVAFEAFDESSLGWESDSEFMSGSNVSLEAMNRIRLGFFTSDETLLLQDLWQWMSEKRSESILSRIGDANLSKVNFVFTRMGKFTVLNLGYLNRWTKSEDNEKGNAFSSISKHMLTHLTGIMELTGVQGKDTVEETIPDENGNVEIVAVNAVDSEKIEESAAGDSPVESPGETPVGSDNGRGKVNASKATTDPTKVGLRTLAIQTLNDLRGEPRDTSLRAAVTPAIDYETDINPPGDGPEEINPLIEGVKKKADALLSRGLISNAEYRRHLRLAESYKEIRSPFTEETLEEFSKIPRELVWDFKPTEIADIPHVKDKSMLKSTLINYDRDYTQNVMQKDVVNLVMNLQKAGVAVTDYKVERRTDALSDVYDYTVKLSPVSGSPSTIRFQLPVINEDGKYMVGGIRYYMRKLRYDKPIRKISPSRVALSTYYGKLFVDRVTKRNDDYAAWLNDAFGVAALMNPPRVTEVVYGDVFTDSMSVPRSYSALASEVISFDAIGVNFNFDYGNIQKNFPEWNGQTDVPVGRRGNTLVTMDAQGYLKIGADSLGHIGKLFGVDPVKRPDESVTLSVLGEDFPLAIILSYLQGLTEMVESFEIKPERRIKGSRLAPDPEKFEIVFADEIWRIPRIPHRDVLIYASFLQWKNVIKNFSVSELDNRDSFNSLLSEAGLSGRYLYEIQNLEALFIDPIAEENLREMNEPTELIPLLMKSAFYLVTDEYPSDLSSEGSLFKGYERQSGAVYRALVDAVRKYSAQPLGAKATVDIPPFLVLSEIQKDPSVALVEDSNPIHNLKEKENVTYSGTGGRSKRSMVRRTRAFHKSDIGIRSEAGVDNGDVGINCFLTANPNLTSLRGTAVTQTDLSKEAGATSLLSTSALISPFATYDDPKRVNFINIQQSHCIQSKGAMVSPIRTGYEAMMAHRVDDTFAASAKGPGRIIEKTKSYIAVKYDDETLGEERIPVGRRFGIVTGHTVPHETICDLPVDYHFEKDQILTFHPKFFQRDWRNSREALAKSGYVANVALVEINETFEDASLISRNLANQLTTTVTHTRTLMVSFNQAIRNLVVEGQHVDIDDTLAFLEDEISANFDFFDEASMETLKRLGNPAPRAKHLGNIEKIEVFYFGEKEDMSDSVRKVADKYDQQRAKHVKSLGTEAARTGQVLSPSRIDGLSLEIDMMAIRIYITHDRGMGAGDKVVVGNQKKSVVSGVFDGLCRTAGPVLPGGKQWDVDLQFSYRSINARIVNSAMLMGMGNILIQNIEQEMLKAYDSE